MVRKLEKYEILEELGHGGMATVYRGRDSRLDRAVAVKVMHPHLRKTPEARDRFTREARSVARLTHPNIVEIYDNSDEGSEEAFIVTELLTGPTLKAFAEQREVPPEVAAAMTIQVAGALHAAHEAGIVHRDVKPENVLLHDNRTLKLTDFGIAQMVDAQSFTATGQILGSPGHMAPEQVEGGDCDARSDLFSLATVLYYLATGRLPFTGRNPHQILKRIVDGDYADPLRVRPSIGGRLRAIIVRGLALRPDDRYPSAMAFAEALRGFLGELEIEDPEALLRDYLADPEKTTEELEEKVVKTLVRAGELAAKKGQVAEATEALNRVLALDEGNPRALAAIESIGVGGTRRSVLYIAGALMGVFGLGAIALAAFGGAPSSGGERAARSDAATPLAMERPQDDAGAPVDAGHVVDASPRDAGRPDAGRRRVDPVAQGATAPQVLRPRRVCFRPNPANVEIAVDGQERLPFGAATRCRDLLPGPHRVDAYGAQGCCEELSRTFLVGAGEGEQQIPLRLRYRDARLYVLPRNPVSGQVQVGGGAAGRTRSFILVPMSSFQATRQFTVTAPGHAAYTGTVRLVAGQDRQVEVTLEASEGAP